MTSSDQPITGQTPARRRWTARGCGFRLIAALFGITIALLLIEALLRISFHSLPEPLQVALQDVHITPFTDARLTPAIVWQSDNDYQTITRPGLQDDLTHGSTSITFHVSTYSWWNGRVGFRSPQPTDGHVDAVVMGDSFAFCFTEWQDCWVNHLTQTSGLSIADLGQPATGSVSHARLFKTFALPIKPPLVIWQFFGNDYNDDYGLAELDGTARTPPLPPPATDTPLKGWLRDNSAIFTIADLLANRGHDPGVEQFVNPYHIHQGTLDFEFGEPYITAAFDMTNPRNLEGEGYSHQALLDTRDLIQGYGGHLLIIIMPTKEQVYRELTAPILGQAVLDGIDQPDQRLLAFCQQQNLTCFDLYPALHTQALTGASLYYSDDIHINAQGNQIVSQAVGQELTQLGWLKS